jgi:hypothetical protein
MAKSTTENLITPAVLNAAQIDSTAVADESITTDKVANSAITDTKILDGSIGTTKLATEAVVESSIGALAVTAAKIANNTITDDKIQNGTILGQSIASGAIGGALIANLGVTLAKLKMGSGPDEINTDEIPEGSTNQFFTDAKAIAAVEGEPTLNLQEGLTVDTDIFFGDYDLLDTPGYDTTGIKVVKPDTKVKWAAISVIEYGGDYVDDLPFGAFHNPTIGGEAHGGSEASPTAVPNNKRVLQVNGSARYGTGVGESHTIANMVISTNENQTSTNRGGRITLRVTPNGTTQTHDMITLTGNSTQQMDMALDPGTNFNKTVISTQSTNGLEIDTQVIVLSNLPTSDPNNPGQLWNDNGTLKVS